MPQISCRGAHGRLCSGTNNSKVSTRFSRHSQQWIFVDMSNNSSRCGADRYRYPVTISSTKQFRPPGLVPHFEPTTLSYLLKMNSCNLCKPPREIAAENNRILEALNINKFLQRVATNVLFVTASSAATLTPENEESSSHRCPQTWIFLFCFVLFGGGGDF